MLLGEYIAKRDILESKINSVHSCIKKVTVSADECLQLLERVDVMVKEFEGYNSLINKYYELIEISSVDNSKVVLSNVIRLREGILKKLSIVDALIENNSESINILDLLDKKSAYLDEFNTFDIIIKKSIWGVSVDSKSVG